MLILKVKLLTPLCCGSGFARAGYVDRDVIFDDAGLPYLPGRRLKGLLRDGYRQVYQVLSLPDPAKLFGEPGEEMPGALTVGNAKLPRADEIRAWLLQVFRESKHTFNRDDVIAHYTEIRRQTAIDRHSGVPDANTLRATRLLRPDLEFFAELNADVAYKEALERAAQALQFMGTSRTRGPGSVECSIQEITMVSQPKAEISGGHRWRSESDSLAYSVRLYQPALFPSLAGDANTVLSHRSVPGSAIRGFLARLYMGKSGVRQRFNNLFCSGMVRFLPASLEIAIYEERRRTVPLPHSVRVQKSDGNCFYDLASQDPGDRPIRRVSGWTLQKELYSEQDAPLVEVVTELQYHHQRAHNPAIGKAVGVEQVGKYNIAAEEAGALFTYEAISASQRFLGEILGNPKDLAEIRDLIPDQGRTVYFGRSKSAQYGGKAFWKWEDADVEDVPSIRPAAPLVVILLTPLMALSERGHPEAVFPTKDLAAELGVKLKLEKSFSRTHWQGGYLSHQRLPRQQMPALAAGSVFVFSVDGTLSADAMAHAKQRSYGVRLEEGFGRIALHSAPESISLERYKAPPASVDLQVAPGSIEYEIALCVLQSHFKSAVRQEALQLAAQPSEEKLGRVTPHMIHRLIFLTEKNPSGLEKLSDRITNVLKHWMVKDETSLFDHLTAEWKYVYQELHKCASPALDRKANWLKITGDPFKGAEEEVHAHYTFAQKLVQYYRLRYLGALTWRKQNIARSKANAAAGANK